jgi:hypothetical protein
MQKANQPPHPKHEEIAALAHQIWEKNGRPAGRDVQFWLQAEQSLLSSIKAPPPAQAPAARAPGSPSRRSAAKSGQGGAEPLRRQA